MTTHATGGKNPPMFPLTHPYLIIAAGMPGIPSAPAAQAPLDVFSAKRRGLTLQGVKDDLEVAEDPATPPKVLENLFEETSSKKVKLAILRNPNTSVELLHERAMASEIDDLRAILANPARIIGRVTFEPLWAAIESFAAMNTSDPEVLRDLAMHPDSDVRKFVGLNSSTPEEVKVVIAQDPVEDVQFDMASFGSDLPEAVQVALARSKFDRVLVELAERVDSRAALKALIKSGDSEVLTIINERTDVPDSIREMASDALEKMG